MTVTLTDVSGDPQITLDPEADTATVTIADNDTATVSVVAIDALAAEEGSNPGQFTVSLTQASSTATVVTYTVGGTATAGTDYTALTGTVTIPAGSLSAVIDVSVLDDDAGRGQRDRDGDADRCQRRPADHPRPGRRTPQR